MGRQAINKEVQSTDTKIQQKPDVNLETLDRGTGDVVLVDEPLTTDYADALAFMEEPVTIRLAPSTDKNAATVFPVWVNGKPAEVFQNGRWQEIGYLPVGQNLVVKRKVLEVILRAKIDRVETVVGDATQEKPANKAVRFTSPVHSVSILEDKNPLGSPWASELMRRNY